VVRSQECRRQAIVRHISISRVRDAQLSSRSHDIATIADEPGCAACLSHQFLAIVFLPNLALQ
jgi:hypothetical protein